jgi:hypothetical protein
MQQPGQVLVVSHKETTKLYLYPSPTSLLSLYPPLTSLLSKYPI